MAYLKNIASSEVLKLADQVQYAAGQVVSKTLVKTKVLASRYLLSQKVRALVNTKAPAMHLLPAWMVKARS